MRPTHKYDQFLAEYDSLMPSNKGSVPEGGVLGEDQTHPQSPHGTRGRILRGRGNTLNKSMEK